MAPRNMHEVLREVDDFFNGVSGVHKAAESISKRLRELEIPFAVLGGLAVYAHGHQRTTADVDVLLTPEGLATFKARWLGRGWVEKFEGSKGMRDVVQNVQIDVLLTGEFPGDGKPKTIEFPHPSEADEVDPRFGFPIPSLKLLISLKLASGVTAKHRMQDLVDVMELIRANDLPLEYSDQLDAMIQDEFRQQWEHAQVDEDA